jgi:predicted AAA+ superfamily ATPase
VGKAGDAEIDFITLNGNEKTYYQVSLSVRDERTLNRELAPLLGVADSYPKYLLTLDNDPVVMHNGIKQMYALDWLLDQ